MFFSSQLFVLAAETYLININVRTSTINVRVVVQESRKAYVSGCSNGRAGVTRLNHRCDVAVLISYT